MAHAALATVPAAPRPVAPTAPGTPEPPAPPEPALLLRTLRLGALPVEPRRWQPREALVDQIRAAAERGAGNGAPCVVTGLAGMGKTHLAAAYARTCAAQGWPVVAWITVQPGPDEEAQIVRQLARLGVALGAAGPNDPPRQAATRLLAWLRRRRGQSLLVYDNVRDPSGLRPWLPAGGGAQAVVVGRERGLRALGETVEAGVFTPDEAREFLSRQTGFGADIRTDRLAAALDYFPLTLALAAGLMAGQRVGYGQYLERWYAYHNHQLLGPGQDQPYRRGIAAAILLALAGVEDPTPDAWYRDLNRALVESLSVLDSGGAGHQMLCAAVAPEHHHDPDAVSVVRGALIRLADAALVSFDDGGRNVTVHPTVSRLIRARALESGTMGWVLARSASGLLAGEPPAEADEDPGGFTGMGTWAGPHAELAAWGAHAESLGDHLTELADQTPQGVVDQGVARRVLELQGAAVFRLSGLDLPKPVLDFARRTVSAHERLLGRDHPDTLACRGNLAFVYGRAGHIDESIALYERTLEDYVRSRGDEHPDTFTSRNNLAFVYGQAGRHDESVALYEQTLVDCERILGPDQPDTLKFQVNLANAFEAADRLDEAVEMFQIALDGCERLFGANAPDTRDVRGNLAFACESAGMYEEAVRQYEKTVQHSEFALGPHHRETLILRNNLAYAYESAGRTQDAVALYERTLADRRRFLGPLDVDTLASYNNLAFAYESAGRFEEARVLYETALVGREKVLGAEHPATFAVRQSLAGLDRMMAEQRRRGPLRLWRGGGRDKDAPALAAGTGRRELTA
ncbi:MAG TPA: tetratricopeptide repeat protein [Actinocrinis sp.]|nr:tetratricopeptide repeat protein [Actinocrinis sp.]